jgi:flagellar FliL protein
VSEPNVEEKDENTEETAQPKPPSPIGKILLIVVVALASSAGGGVLSWFLISKTINAQAHSEAADPAKQKEDEVAEALEKGGALALEPFVVNLADADAARYLRIKVSLMVDDKHAIKELTENLALQMKVRDVVLQMLTVKTSSELMDEEGKKKLREEIHAKIAAYFRKPKLVDVMFTEFVIQL